jgi:putative hemolysin
MDLLIWLELGLFIVLMGLSGFFSSSETALFSLDSVQLQQMRQDKNPRADLIERMLSSPRRLIITILIGNEFVNVAASVISAAVVIELLGPENKWLNLLIMVPILLLIGEITPKTLAIRNNIAFATAESGPIEFFARLIKPVRWLVRLVADFFITLIVGRERSRGNIITEDMVRTLAHEAVGEGVLDVDEARFIDQIFDFGSKTLEDILTPRSDIFFLSVDTPLNEVVKEQQRTRHTKVPVYKENRDTVIGVLHARDLLGVQFDSDPGMNKGGLETLLREPYFVPESKPAVELFDAFRTRKLSIAVTVDEYGGVTGLVTMEDLLECIFGDIYSPSDPTPAKYLTDIGDGRRYDVDGAIPIIDLNEAIGSGLSDQVSETLGGLLLHEFGELPPTDTTILLGDLRCTIKEVKENRIKKILLELLTDEDITRGTAEQELSSGTKQSD